MTEFTRVVPCTIKFSWSEVERETSSEPSVDEEFYLDSVSIGGVEFLEMLGNDVDELFYKLLKGDGNERSA